MRNIFLFAVLALLSSQAMAAVHKKAISDELPPEALTAESPRPIPKDTVYSKETQDLLSHTYEQRRKIRQEQRQAQEEREKNTPTYTEADMRKTCAKPKVIERARMTEAVFDIYKTNAKRCFTVQWAEFINAEVK